MTRYPLSMKIVLIILGVVLGMSIFMIPTSNGQTYDANEILIPDAFIPWNEGMDELVAVLDKIYQYDGKDAKWAMCATSIDGIWQMCLRDENKAAPFTFQFQNGKLAGYTAKFDGSQYGHLIHSAKTVYKGGGRGTVSSKSRDFRIYEMEMKGGWLELYLVFDKPSDKIRLQAKYRHTAPVEKVEEEPIAPPEIKKPMDLELKDPVERGKDEWHTDTRMAFVSNIGSGGRDVLECLTILTLQRPSSQSTKWLEAPLWRLTALVLASPWSGTN